MSFDSHEKDNNAYKVQIDGKPFELAHPGPTGRELLALVGKTPDGFLLAFVVPDEADILVEPDEVFDLSAPGVEAFTLISKERHYAIRIDEHPFNITDRTPTGRELLALVGKDPETHLLTLSLENQDDHLIDPDERVDLSSPGREQFYVVAKKPLTIVIDEVIYHPAKKELTGSELRALPNPPVSPNRDLWLDVPGKDDLRIQPTDTVKLKDGMVFYTAPSTINPGQGGLR